MGKSQRRRATRKSHHESATSRRVAPRRENAALIQEGTVWLRYDVWLRVRNEWTEE